MLIKFLNKHTAGPREVAPIEEHRLWLIDMYTISNNLAKVYAILM